MFRDRLRSFLFDPATAAPNADTLPVRSVRQPVLAEPPPPVAPHLRHSHGLEQFFHALRDRQGLSILDLGEVNQPNVGYITSLGHRLYSEDFIRSLDAVFGTADPEAAQAHPAKVREFLHQSLQFPARHFDAALIWDSFEYLSRPMLALVLERLLDVLAPQAMVLAFFHAEVKTDTVPTFSYRIADGSSLQLVPKSQRKALQTFNNRSIEKLFDGCASVKFFLTRESLREVIVRR